MDFTLEVVVPDVKYEKYNIFTLNTIDSHF